MIRAAKKDANHNSIAAEFAALGYAVLDVSQLKNCCDMFVSKRDITVAVEVKDGDKPPSARRLTEGEERFRQGWKGRYRIVETVGDVHQLHRELFICQRVDGAV